MPVDIPELVVFTSDCGHQFIGDMAGDYTCPECGRADGDHHLVSTQHFPVQSGLSCEVSWGG